MSQSPCSTHTAARPPTTEVLLDTVIEGVDLAVSLGELAAPSLLVMRRPLGPEGAGPDAAPQLLARPVPVGVHPADALATDVLPAGLFAVGCAALASACSTDGGTAPRHTAFSFLLHQDGTSVLQLAGTPRHVGHEADRTGPEGILADACRRVLRLPTSPPDAAVVDWSARRWLDRVFADVVSNPELRWTWERITDRHPLPDRHLLQGCTWSSLRLACSRADAAVFGVSPTQAAWMDDGMFSRHLLDAYPPPEVLLAELQPLVPADVHDRLTAALR